MPSKLEISIEIMGLHPVEWISLTQDAVCEWRVVIPAKLPHNVLKLLDCCYMILKRSHKDTIEKYNSVHVAVKC